MIIINLNLLPPHRKTEQNRLVKFLFIKNILEFIIIAAAIIATILLWGWMILIDEFTSLTKNAMSIGRDYTSYNTEVRTVNRTLRAIGETSNGYLNITEKLLFIASTTPANIRINSLDINRVNNQIIIYGTAKTRADLIAYQETVKQIPWLEATIMPTTQLLQKENINFEYQTKLKQWPIIKIIGEKKK
ncbi:MAG: hypothetical protein WCX97_02810 [Candidatus Magasanikbacteria bacterium]